MARTSRTPKRDAPSPRRDGERRSRSRGGAHAHDLLSRPRAAASSVSSVPGSARRPVRARNTSSSDGSRTARGRRLDADARRAPARRRSARACRRSRSGAARGRSRTTAPQLEPVEDARRPLRPRRRPARSAPRTVPPRRRFSSAAVPSARTRAVVDHHDPVRQEVGLLEVLGGEQDGGAVGHQPADGVPEVAAARPGRGRSSARRGTARAGGGRGRPPGRGAAACRRSRCGPGGPPASESPNAPAARPPAGRSRGAAGGSGLRSGAGSRGR